jgi:uncharacterized membrane protein YczE
MKKSSSKQFCMRVIIMLLAVTLMGFALSLLVRAHMGTDCYACMTLGISAKLGTSLGVMQLSVNAVLLIGVLFLDRSRIGVGTVGNMVVVGFAADFFKGIYARFLPVHDAIWVSVLLMLAGTVLISIGVSLYFCSNLGVAPYDSLAFIVNERTKIPFKWCRVAIDVTALVIGWALGSVVGVGTVLIAFTLGPQITFFNKHISAKVYRNLNCE